MSDQDQHLNTLKDIRQMMERSSRFISLSGFSGISAGVCALVGAWFANGVMQKNEYQITNTLTEREMSETGIWKWMDNQLFLIAVATFIAALFFAFIFTYIRSKKTNTPVWGSQARRLMINVFVPMITGGIFLFALMENHVYALIAPGCLIFYGLAVLNASKYTLPELRYLGYAQILLGIVSLAYTEYGIYFWALGFGLFHIIYGSLMWWRYER